MNYVILAVLMLIQAANISRLPPSGIPPTPGVYYHRADGGWMPIPKASIAEAKPKGLIQHVETGGYTNLGVNIVCRGATAATRFSSPKPVFYVREIGKSEDAMLIRLKQKRRSRSYDTSSGNSTVENKEGLRRADIRRTDVTPYSDGTYSIVPATNLKPGEYLLILGNAAVSYDFGIDPK